MKISCTLPTFIPDVEAFAFLSKCGFNATEFALRHYFLDGCMFGDIENVTDEMIKEYFTMLKGVADEAGIEIYQTHGTGSGHASKFNYDYDDMAARCIASIKATHYLGSKHCVIHPVQIPGRRYDFLNKEAFDKSVEFYSRLIPTLEEYDVYCDIENMWVRDPVYGHICSTILSHGEEMVEMCEALGDRFGICVDVGHCNLTQDDPAEMVRIAGDKLGSLHAHETDGISDLHTLPFSKHAKPSGMAWDPMRTDWEDFMKALDDVGYTGSLNFETGAPGPLELKEAGYTYLAAIGRYLVSLRDPKFQ